MHAHVRHVPYVADQIVESHPYMLTASDHPDQSRIDQFNNSEAFKAFLVLSKFIQGKLTASSASMASPASAPAPPVGGIAQ